MVTAQGPAQRPIKMTVFSDREHLTLVQGWLRFWEGAQRRPSRRIGGLRPPSRRPTGGGVTPHACKAQENPS